MASGDPLPDAVVLWTRLLPTDPLPDTDVDVEWEVATDAELTDVVAAGSAVAVAALGHSVHVDVTGLEPDTEYHYRFRVAEFATPAARTRTFAAPGTTPERFRFAFSSCQNWEHGYYAAYRDLVEQGDLDAFVFLGDYIYENPSGGATDPRARTTGQTFECETIEQYRERYAVYKSDPLLQAAHALGAVGRHVGRPRGGQRLRGQRAATSTSHRDAFLARRAAGYQVWYEHMPVRLDPPTGPDFDIYRSFAHGDLVRFHVLDTRQYRADQQREAPFVEALGDVVQVRDDVLAASAEQTMLGAPQREWLLDGVAASTAIWDVIAQQVFMFGGNAVVGADPPVVVVDTWDGYDGERRVVLDAVGASADNLVVLTGDFHAAVVADLRVDPYDPLAAGGGRRVHGVEHLVGVLRRRRDGGVARERRADRQPTDQVVRLPARVHGLRGHARPLARHLPRGGRSVRRGVTRRAAQHVGDRRRHPRRRPGVLTASALRC